MTQIKIVYFINSFKTGSCSSPITPPNIYTPASLLTRSFVEKYGGNEQLPWIMEKCFLDKIERRTWRSPFPEGLPSGWAEGCTGATQEHLLDRKGWLYLFNEREIKMKTSEAFLWRHSAWMEPWQLPHTFTGLQGTVSHLAQLQPVSSCKEFSTSSLDPEPSYPFPIKKKKCISLNTIPSLLYLLEKYGLVFLLSTCVCGTDSSVKKQNFSIQKRTKYFALMSHTPFLLYAVMEAE